MFYTKIISDLKSRVEDVILFHSGTGKDSIALCDILSKEFKSVYCVFMYFVKDLDYEKKYIDFAKKLYPNIIFYQTPHYAIYSFIKNGYLGIKKDEQVRKLKISHIDKFIKEKTGIEFSVYGFKKNDGITRRLMLNNYSNGICENTKKAYPLMDMTNKDVLTYISDNNLITPFNYNNKKPSSGCDISQPTFLSYIRDNYPNDLIKIFNQFPFCENILFKYDNYGENKHK